MIGLENPLGERRNGEGVPVPRRYTKNLFYGRNHMHGRRKNCALQAPLVVPYKALQREVLAVHDVSVPS